MQAHSRLGRGFVIYLMLLVLFVSAACGHAKNAEPNRVPTQQARYSVTLTDVGDQKVNVIKVIRQVTGLGLFDAKQIVDSAPSVVQSELTHDAAKVVADKLAGVGASVELTQL